MAPDKPEYGRREVDLDRRRWNDDRLDDLAHTVRSIAPLATQVARHDAVLDQLVDTITNLKTGVGDLDERLTRRIEDEAQLQAEFRREYRRDRERDEQARKRREERAEQDAKKARKQRGAIVLAAIPATSAVLVALIYAAVSLINGAPT